ncbi:DUF4825 domain-containing protein [Sporosarcina sp. G11-34]|uniref:DUF4825 domain-containing protein n=1 Tax=Sporosarcina sp. G11-34 TaxID=2849605 RepID=UPI0022A92250|nr:DUF4825 domain-containing protein [Sporosarcina sp. G11-34]MCZ2257929.1 DUF4825 domain-containing protein [Sporosarcina sp. G11-34]
MKLKISIGLLIVGLLLFGWVQVYYLPKIDALAEQKQLEQLEPETHHFSSMLEYANLYMGNSGNNTNLVNNLPMSDVFRLYEQNPDEFTFRINYDETVEGVGKERVEKSILYNATAIFTLIENMEIVEFSFVDDIYTVTRKRVNEWFDEDVSTFNDELVFEEKVQQPIIKKERLTEWFDAYIGGGN